MRIFNRDTETLKAPVSGNMKSIETVEDEVFSTGLMGGGIAFDAEGTQIVAPCSGTVDLMFDTGHAVNIISDKGVEVLIHIGLDTVKLNGKGFETYKKNGDKVKAGELLISFDPDLLKEQGFDTTVLMVVCNTDQYKKVTPQTPGHVDAGDSALRVGAKK